MKAQFKAENPSDIQMTMTLTMTLGEWREIGEHLTDTRSFRADGKLLDAIRTMVRKASQHFDETTEEA
ncbi:hypothetical protein [Paraburkholderia acidisoli]|uniref:Uncharacterized protein n=1 Tax=Paraburkholderia acidisoli TaxID=2571748 RepID=A0A7Z2GQX2_9BURK|nr:hypothetical protein [Paraburkholderia acidisoli]QGZ66328.1 hypothetical protein FAZ98_31535 [Paraburkholderia acidisoli]